MTGGPPITDLVHRLVACPDDFLAAPLAGGGGVVSVAAGVGDVLRARGVDMIPDWIECLAPSNADVLTTNWLRACLVTAWLAEDGSIGSRLTGDALLRFLGGDLHRLAGLVRADQLVHDPDRREELARLLVRSAGLTPGGETEPQAADRLSTLDSVNRTRVEAEARRAEERAREVRAAMAQQRAEEAAARASRE